MPAIIRYVLFELIKIFSMSMFALCAFFLSSDLLKQLQREGLGLAQTLYTIPYLLPYVLRTSSHGAMLFAVCAVYGRMAATNEIVAVKSMGISPLRLIWPALWLTLPICLGGVWLDELGEGWGMRGVERVVLDFTDEMAYTTLRTYRTFRRQDFSIAVRNVEGRKLIRPALSYRPPNDERLVTVVAAEGEMHIDQANRCLRFVLHNGQVSMPNEFDMKFEDTIEPVLPLKPTHNPVAVTSQLIAEFEKRAGNLKHELALASFGDTTTEQYRKLLESYGKEQRDIYWLRAKLQLRWANSFCVMAFALIGAPVSILMRRGDFLTCFGLCFVPIVAAYQPLQFFGCSLAQGGLTPAWTVWCGDFVLGLVGIWLLRRVEVH
jgi:lipopolysaccharide export system permease protein